MTRETRKILDGLQGPTWSVVSDSEPAATYEQVRDMRESERTIAPCNPAMTKPIISEQQLQDAIVDYAHLKGYI